MYSPTTPEGSAVIKLYGNPVSGHSHRVELFLSLLGLSYEFIKIDLTTKEQKSDEFLGMNPFGQIPVIKDGHVTLADSNAILVYLAQTYAPNLWLPHEPHEAAKVQRWLTVAAGMLAFGPAVARAGVLFNRPFNLEEVTTRSNSLFKVMDHVLKDSLFLIGDQPTIADIANYSYVVRAPEGNLSLAPYPYVQIWLARIEVLPGFTPMMKSVA
jgi:glutathione S-transferase